MKTTLLLFLTLLTSIQLSAQIKVNHIAVHVSDLEKSMAFYQSILGLQEIDEPFKDGLHAWYDIGGGAALHLIEADRVPTEISKTNHLCFSMSDMDSFIQRLKAADYPFEDWPGKKDRLPLDLMESDRFTFKIQMDIGWKSTMIISLFDYS